MAELVDAHALGACIFGCGGSSPLRRTREIKYGRGGRVFGSASANKSSHPLPMKKTGHWDRFFLWLAMDYTAQDRFRTLWWRDWLTSYMTKLPECRNWR